VELDEDELDDDEEELDEDDDLLWLDDELDDEELLELREEDELEDEWEEDEECDDAEEEEEDEDDELLLEDELWSGATVGQLQILTQSFSSSTLRSRTRLMLRGILKSAVRGGLMIHTILPLDPTRPPKIACVHTLGLSGPVQVMTVVLSLVTW